MTVADMLRHWAASKLSVPVGDVLSVTFRHEDGWTSESGTGWPEENYAVIKLCSTAKGYPKNPRKREVSVEGFESIPDLLLEIIEAATDADQKEAAREDPRGLHDGLGRG